VSAAGAAPDGASPTASSMQPASVAAPRRSQAASPPPIDFVLGLVLAINLAALLAAVTFAFTWATDRIGERAVADTLEARGDALGIDLSATIDRSVSRLETAAERLSGDPSPASADVLDALVEEDTLLSWAGLADLDGTLVAASGGEGVGSSVAMRTWFADALAAPLAADVMAPVAARPAALPAPPQDDRLVSLGVPVKDDSGRVVAVLGADIAAEGALARLRAMAGALGVEAKLVAASGVTLIATGGVPNPSWSAESARAAAIGVAGVLATRRTEAVAAQHVAAELSAERLPQLPWKLAVRLPEGTGIAAGTPPPGSVALFLAGAVAVYGLVAFLFVRLYIRPIRRLVATAVDIAEGRHDAYPFESRRTAEAASLSAALGIIERRLHDRAETPARAAAVAALPRREAALARREAA